MESFPRWTLYKAQRTNRGGRYGAQAYILAFQALRSKIGATENVSDRYVERRKRNNEAAKRCRANRRALFEFRFKRTQQLEQENALLRDDIEQLTKEVLQLKEQLLMQQQRSGIACSLKIAANYRHRARACMCVQ